MSDTTARRPLSEVKQTLVELSELSGYDPKRTLAAIELLLRNLEVGGLIAAPPPFTLGVRVC
jgi:hypothetical protein